MISNRNYDIVVYGATGFTGALVCEYLAKRSADHKNLRWAMAGRSLSKLEEIRTKIDDETIPLIIADASDQNSLDALAKSTKTIITTVGPYQLYGTPLVEACIQSGTDYVDLCGEPIWMRQMIDAHANAARESGSRILFSCGFDSIPAELGVWFCQQEAIRRFGKPMPRIRGRVRKFVGGPSGGSVASGMATMKAASDKPELAKLLADPFALTPGFSGPTHPSDQTFETEPDLGPVGPFMLGPTDAKNVHRSNFLMGHPYGAGFVYDEKLVGAKPPAGPPPSMDNLPKPGDGPGADIMKNGCFDILFIGSDHEGAEIRTSIVGSLEPGYITTSKMITETALSLLEADDLPAGIWTPGAALKDNLLKRLTNHASVIFSVE